MDRMNPQDRPEHAEALPLNERAYGFAMGAAYAVVMALYAWVGGLFGKGGASAKMIGDVYPGFRPTLLGGFVGAAYGFLIGFPFGFTIARTYNEALRCPAMQCKCPLCEVKSPQS